MMNASKTIVSSKQRLLARMWRDRGGMAATEFAMILPLMLTMFLGAVEISNGVSIDRKVTIAVRTVTDLVSQSAVVSNSDMTNILNAAAKIVAPYSETPMKITVSQVKIDSGGAATVTWSDSLNAVKRATGSSVTLPPALAVPDTYLIFGEIQYAYAPPVGAAVVGNINLNENFYVRPRQSATVSRTP